MFDKKYEDRLRAWVEFRARLENSDTPIQDTIDFYNRAPLVSISVDPYDETTWLDPWNLLYENTYCDFSIILAMAYTLQLTTRFTGSKFEIHICTNYEVSEVKYLLYIDQTVLGYCRNLPTDASNIPQNLKVEKQYSLKPLQ